MKSFLLFIFVLTTATAVKFDCIYEVKTWFDIELYTCKATVSNTGSHALKNVTGTQSPGKTLNDVEALSIVEQSFSTFPSDIGVFLANLKLLYVFDVPLTVISAKDLKGLSNLEFFAIEGAMLTTLDGDLFKFTPNLKEIQIQSSALAHIGEGFVASLSALNILDLTGSCITQKADNHAAVQSLALALSLSCPPLATTTISPTEKCTCNDKIGKLELKIAELKDHEKLEIEKLQVKIKELKDHENVEIEKLQVKIKQQEMEKKILSDEVKDVVKRLKAVEKHQSCTSQCLA